jgi:hypothetical protein
MCSILQVIMACGVHMHSRILNYLHVDVTRKGYEHDNPAFFRQILFHFPSLNPYVTLP